MHKCSKHLCRISTIIAMTFLCAFASAAEQPERLQREIEQLKQQKQQAEARLKELRKTLADRERKLRQANEKAGARDISMTQFHLPRLEKAPSIDGVVGEEEWSGAIGLPMGAGLYAGLLKRKSSICYIGWDPDHIYFAQRLPLREGERLKRLNREPEHDNVYAGETSCEVYVDRKSSGSIGQPCRWQFMGNAVGNKWDREDQYTIGQNFPGWDGQWQYKQRLTPDGDYWEAEIAIPRQTVYKEEPIQAGDLWWIGMAMNLHRPWTWSGFYGWKIPATFSASVPEIRMRHPQRSHQVHGIAFDVTVRNTTGEPFQADLVVRLADRKRKETIFEKRFRLDLDPGQKQQLQVSEPVEKAQDERMYTMSAMVVRDGQSIYTWSHPIRYNHPQNDKGLEYEPEEAPFVLEAAYAPVSNYVRLMADIYDFAEKDRVAAVQFAVRHADQDQVLGSTRVEEFDYGKGQAMLDLPEDLAPGRYRCEARLLDAEGESLASHGVDFERKDLEKEFPWLGNELGEEEVVLDPFDRLDADPSSVRAFRKEIVLDGSALPEQVRAADVDLLSGPIAFRGRADGKAFTVWAVEDGVELQRESEAVAEYTGRASGGPLRVRTHVRWEYDSTARVRVTLQPAEGQDEAEMDALQLVLPFTEEGATHFMANGLNMRLSNVAGYIPGEGRTGTVWDSTGVPYQKMTVGSFVPIVWLGNLSSGITWFADSDAGWWPTDDYPAIEIIRVPGGGTELVLNIASAPVSFSGDREIEFGLNVNPVRRRTDHHPSTITFGFRRETGRWDPEKTKHKVYSRRYPDDVELNRRFVRAAHKYGEIYSPYTEMSSADFFREEYNYFQEEWRSGESGGGLLQTESSNDCLLYWTKRWIEDAGLDGFYFDNVNNKLNYNIRNGTAYRLPDGRIQPGYSIWSMRRQIIRTRAVVQQYSDEEPNRICIHNTRYQFAPTMGFADLAMGGEMPTPRPETGDFMEMYPRDYMDVMYNVPLWGYKLSHLYHFRWKNYTDEFGEYDREAAMKVHRSAMATMLVHGVEFFQGIEYKGFLMGRFRMLKQLPGGRLEFTPSWQADGLFRVTGGGEDVDAAIWHKDGVLLLIVANYSRHAKRAKVWMDFPELLDPPAPMERRTVLDLETMEFPGYLVTGQPEDCEGLPRLGGMDKGHNIMHMANEMRVKVQPRDFRAILIVDLPFAKGAGF